MCNTCSVRLISLVLLLLVQGCTPPSFWHYGPDRQSLEVFKQRVEAAFRLQNSLTSEMMLLQETEDSSNNLEPILAAEQVMQKNCSYLNEYASRDIDGEGPGLVLQHRVEQSLLDCENAAHHLRALLAKIPKH
jgi:hypothetical protein